MSLFFKYQNNFQNIIQNDFLCFSEASHIILRLCLLCTIHQKIKRCSYLTILYNTNSLAFRIFKIFISEISETLLEIWIRWLIFLLCKKHGSCSLWLFSFCKQTKFSKYWVYLKPKKPFPPENLN